MQKLNCSELIYTKFYMKYVHTQYLLNDWSLCERICWVVCIERMRRKKEVKVWVHKAYILFYTWRNKEKHMDWLGMLLHLFSAVYMFYFSLRFFFWIFGFYSNGRNMKCWNGKWVNKENVRLSVRFSSSFLAIAHTASKDDNKKKKIKLKFFSFRFIVFALSRFCTLLHSQDYRLSIYVHLSMYCA